MFLKYELDPLMRRMLRTFICLDVLRRLLLKSIMLLRLFIMKSIATESVIPSMLLIWQALIFLFFSDRFLTVQLSQRKYLEMQLKVNGKKSNLGDNVIVRCEDQKVVIKSKVFLPKRSLRFLSKKFLKKAWNVQVISKNKSSYEYKYVGTA